MGSATFTPKEERERVSVFLRAEQLAALRAINTATGIPVAVLIRKGVDLVLSQHGQAGPTTARKGGRR
jgi:hypothetical protein